MKKKTLTIAISFFCFHSSFSQVKAYAYAEPVLPGTIKRSIDEKGNQVEQKPKSAVNYLFYLEYKKSITINPTGIWFKDKAYYAKAEPVKKTPVEMVNYNIPNQPEKITLVPATTGKVSSLFPDYSKTIDFKPTGRLKKLLIDCDVVFEYMYRGKRHYKAVKKITMLEPVATQ